MDPTFPPLSTEDFHRVQYAFANRLPSGVPGIQTRVQQFQRLADTLVPGRFEWHPWTMKMVEALCTRRWCGISGCSNSSKTFNISTFACLWWLVAPKESSVIFCSTTMKMLRKRAWQNVHGFYQAVADRVCEFGNFVDSRTLWQCNQGDDLHAIFCLAVLEGDQNKTAANIQGIHTKRQLVIIDEAEAVPSAIWKAAANLYSYPIDSGGEFVLVAIANSRSRLSQFGRFIEPENGWNSVSVDTDEWESVPQMDGKRAQILRFDFRKSPNITEGRQVSIHLPSKERVDATLKALAARGALNDPEHWCYQLSFPVPEGFAKTVFSETMLEKCDVYGKHQFTGRFFMVLGAFDPAYGGGDRPALRFAVMGEIEQGVMGIEVLPPTTLFLDATSTDPVRYQLLRQIRESCKAVEYRGTKKECLPENFCLDCSGDAGLADIMQREWSPRINRIQFAGACHEEPCSLEDKRPAHEVYRNLRAEMFFRARGAAEAGQLKGLDKDSASELCTIDYSDARPDGSLKLVTLIDKKEYRVKYQKSPDYADSFAMILEIARLRGFRLKAVGKTAEVVEDEDKSQEVAQAVYGTSDYSQPEEPTAEEMASEF